MSRVANVNADRIDVKLVETFEPAPGLRSWEESLQNCRTSLNFILTSGAGQGPRTYRVNKDGDQFSVLLVRSDDPPEFYNLSYATKQASGEWVVCFEDTFPEWKPAVNKTKDAHRVAQHKSKLRPLELEPPLPPTPMPWISLMDFISITKEGPSVDVEITFHHLPGVPRWNMSLTGYEFSRYLYTKDNVGTTGGRAHHRFISQWTHPDGDYKHNITRKGWLEIRKNPEVILDGTRTKWNTLVKDHVFLGQIFLAFAILLNFCDQNHKRDPGEIKIPYYIVEDICFDIRETVTRKDMYDRWQESDVFFTEKKNNLNVYPTQFPYQFMICRRKSHIAVWLHRGIQGAHTLLSRVEKYGQPGSGWCISSKKELDMSRYRPFETLDSEQYTPLADFVGSSTGSDGQLLIRLKNITETSLSLLTYDWCWPIGVSKWSCQYRGKIEPQTKLSVDRVFKLESKIHDACKRSGTFNLTIKYASTTREVTVEERNQFLGQILPAVVILLHDDTVEPLRPKT